MPLTVVQPTGVNTSATFTFYSANINNTLTVTGNANTGNIGATTGVFSTVSGALTTGSQPNITSTGTLTSLSVSGNANTGNLGTTGVFATTLSATGNANTGNIGATTGVFTTVAGALTTGSQPNITSTGTLTALTVGPNSSVTLSGTSGYVKANSIQGTDGTNTIFMYYGNVTGAAGIYGNLTVGTSGSGNLYVNSDANILANLNVSGKSNLGPASNVVITGGSANYVLSTDGAGNLSWAAASSGANITDNTTSSSTFYPVYATASSGSFTTAGITTTKLQFVPSTGQLTCTDLNTLSDITLKENIQTIDNPIDVLSQLNGVAFNWNDTGKKSYGVIAQALESIMPELVSETAQGKKTVNYLPIIAFLIEGVKKLQTEIELLKQR